MACANSAGQWDHDPDAKLPYSIDWARGGSNDGSSADLGWLQGDTIAASSWTVPSGLTEVSDSFTDTVATIIISGGTAGTIYEVVNHITTALGLEDDRTITLNCKER
jgi:hypothetical protein